MTPFDVLLHVFQAHFPESRKFSREFSRELFKFQFDFHTWFYASKLKTAYYLIYSKSMMNLRLPATRELKFGGVAGRRGGTTSRPVVGVAPPPSFQDKLWIRLGAELLRPQR
jgi:hypothetical protein